MWSFWESYPYQPPFQVTTWGRYNSSRWYFHDSPMLWCLFLALYPHSIYDIPRYSTIYIYISPEDFSGHHLADRRTGVGLAAQATRIHFFQIPMVMTHHPGHSGTSLEVMPMAGNVPLRASNKWDGRKRKAVEMGDIFLEMRGRVISSKWSYGLLDCFWSPVSRGWSSSGKTTETTAHPMKNVEVSVEFPRPTNLCLSLTGNLAQPVLLASDLDAFWVLMTRSSTKWYKSDSSPRFLWCMLFQLGSHQSVNQNCWALQDLREILKILML